MMKGSARNSIEFVDWLEKIDEAGGELSWISQRKHFPQKTSENVHPVRRDADQIIRSVIESRRVQSAIKAEMEDRGCSKKIVQAEAEQILLTMAHRMQMSAVRTVGYAVVKVIRMIFDRVFVNSSQLVKIRELFNNDAVVFMPTHKTYVDFLLISLLCFHHDICLPAIAAGMDFMNSRFMGEALRRCGAFFIRRRFGNDCLYWSIFTEYVQTHLINADHPVEFFIEGTRSRSNKSLYPKYGLLQVLLEPYLRGQLFDMVIIPVTMNYDKILEEKLYAYELLGFPKPKESTSGLFKSRQILNKKFGKVYVTFGEPISIRKYFGTSLHRSAFVCQPDSQFKVSEVEKMAIRKFGHDIVRIHNENNVTTIWPYACAILLQTYEENRAVGQPESLSIGELYDKLQKFVLLSQKLGVDIPLSESLEDDLRYYLELHSDLFDGCKDFGSSASLLESASFTTDVVGFVERHFLEKSVSRVILLSYANQMIHNFANVGLVCLILMQHKSVVSADALRTYSELQMLLDHEFICLPGQSEAEKSFFATVRCLERASIVSLTEGFLMGIDEESIHTLASIVLPFVCVYQITIQTAFGFAGTSVSDSLLIGGTQRRIMQLYSRAGYGYLRLSGLSSDPIRNAIASLSTRNALVKQPDCLYQVDGVQLHLFAKILQAVSPYDIPCEGQSPLSKL